MEAFDLEGLFWLATKPEDEIAGHLRFSPATGAELDLIGSFYERPPTGTMNFSKFPGDDRPVRIHGVAESRLLTLDRCLLTSRRLSIPGITREKFHVPLIFSGGHLDEGHPLEFESAKLHLRYLEHWVNKSGVDVHFQTEGSKAKRRTNITYTPPENSTVSTNFGEVELSFSHGIRHNRPVEVAIEERCAFNIRFSTRRTIEDVLSVCSALQDLLTIGLHVPSGITGLSLDHSEQTLGLYAPFAGAATQRDLKAPSPLDMLFTFDAIGGLEAVARWVETACKYQPVIGSLVNHWYVPGLYTENRFFNAFAAAEAMRRIQLKKQSINMTDGLKELAVQAGSTFTELVRDVNKWINRVVQVRTNQIVHRGLQETSEWITLHTLADSLYFLVVICLLRECDVSEDALTKIENHGAISLLRERISTLA